MTMKKQVKGKVIFVRMTDEEHQAIFGFAEQERRSIASVIRQAVKEFLERKERDNVEKF